MRLLRSVAIGVALGVFAFNASGAGCNPVSDFQCVDTEDCIAQGAGGVCEGNNFCTFPDPGCPSGKRWHDRAAEPLANTCFEDNLPLDTDTDTDAMSSSESSTTMEPEEMTSSTTMSVESASSSGEPMTTTEPMTSGSSGGSETAAPGACDMMYGGATDYMLCMETADSCSFNTTIGMAMSCTDVCTSFGGTCVGAELNDAELCTSTGAGTCDQADVSDIICVCSL
jgi:hypothetical protein